MQRLPSRISLTNIRKKQRNIEQDIKSKLNTFLHSSTYSKYIQENVVTIRNDRYVIPIKEEYRSQIKGFVHDISSSGSTVFIEPIVVFELNNEIAIAFYIIIISCIMQRLFCNVVNF